MPKGKLMESIQLKKLNIEDLPSPPSVAVKLLELFDDPDVALKDIAKVIQVDPALTAKIVSYCNSPLIQAARPIETLDGAIVMLGMGAVRMLALSFSLFNVAEEDGGFDYSAFWAKSLALAVSTQSISHLTQMNPDESFLAGLMTNIGEIAVYRQTPDEALTGPKLNSIESVIEHENKSLGFNRFEVGAEILSRWNFPEAVVQFVKDINQDQTGKQRRQADLSWQLASLFSSTDATLEQIQSCKDKFHGELTIDEEALELLFAAAQTKWIDYAKLLSFRHDATAMSLRDIELAAKAKMTEISISHLKAQQKIAAENEKLRTTVYRDPLTDVLNRRAYEEQSSQAFARCCRVKSFYSLLVVDIDYFKECNDSYGHQIGDEALIHIAKLLTSVLREYDNVYRYGGEEFIVTLSDCNQEMSLAVAERLRELVESNPLRADGKVIRLTISVGVVSTEFANAQSVVELFEMADKCLYRAKASGRNQCILMTQDILDSLNFESTETIEQT